MEKKIRVTLPKRILEIIECDIEEFGLKKNTLLNYIYEELGNVYDIKNCKSNYKGETEIIQFNLNKKNKVNYYNFLEEKKVQNESEFFREILIEYAERGKKNRELFLYKDTVERLQIAIKERRISKLLFKDGNEIEVEPYYLGSSKLELANYIFCYNLKDGVWKNYKLKYIKSIYLKNENFKVRDKVFVDSIKKDFDPFLSKGKVVKVKLTTNGERLFKELMINRPRILNREDGVYFLECSEEKAKRYFSFFLDEVEILEPKILREWFKEKYEKAILKYKS
ncbi:WYL domain-containing protein [uncultured Cetobacterium sp.]|uniref:WYL domain-containing protein n=1 Tax=uncultured Cetobacterium sp. TaxID=527638 RepID=UPI002621FBBB|nr:WYL domain-containing protein [uncultured Cetobacterium sp.]